MDEANSSIPTQPWVVPNNSWPVPSTPNPFTGYTCPTCGSWVQHGTLHQCPGWNPGTITTDNTFLTGLGEISMYADYVKLLRRDTLSLFMEKVVEKLLDIEQNTPAESGFVGFGIDVLQDVFDEVAKEVGDKSGV